jgi:hypothetical protein
MPTPDALAILEIQQLLYRYCRGVDRGDVALIKSVYHPGAHDAHGSFKGPAETFAEGIVARMDAASLIGQHHITNALIEVDGEVAHGESYFLAYHPDEAPGANRMGLAIAGGRYLDRFERRDGVWKIADRRVILDFTRQPVAGAAWRAQRNFAQGGRRQDDPSWGFVAAG